MTHRLTSHAPPSPCASHSAVPAEDIYGDNIANLSAVAQMSNLVKLDELTENSILKVSFFLFFPVFIELPPPL